MSNRNVLLAAMVAAAGTCACALAQDSVSKFGPPQAAGASDALSPWDLRFQSEEYVVRTSPIVTSWGTRFAVAPLMKASNTQPGMFENGLISAQAISRCYAPAVLKSAYERWNGLGLGVHDDNNNVPGAVSPSFVGLQFGAGFAEFGGLANNIISGVASVCRNDPTTLYVNRIVAATNGVNATQNTAQVGLGTVDGSGNVAFRADGFGLTIPPGLTGNNIVRVDGKARNLGVVNQLSNVGGNTAADLGATSYLINANAVSHGTPNLIPEELCGVSKYIGVDFNSNYKFNDGAGSTMAIFAGPLTNSRGSVAFSKKPLLASPGGAAVGTGGILAKPGAAADTTAFAVWNVDCDGAVVDTPIAMLAPANIVDACTGYNFPMNGVDSLGNPVVREFDHYHSQVFSRGGNSPLALGCDRAGNLLAVAEANKTGNITDAENGLVAARINAAGATQWSLVAYNGEFNYVFTGQGRGKPVLDGPGGSEIGYISTLFELTNGGTLGPSISAGSVDSLGNVWFVAPVWYPASLPAMDTDFVDPLEIDVTLLRAVYSDTPAGPCWELEAVLRAGDIIPGRDSKADYRIGFIEIADSNSVSSGGFWSQNAMQEAFFRTAPATLAQTSNRATGGVLLSCAITYDADGDGVFSTTPEAAGDNDEEYSVILYLGPDAPTCTADLNGDGTVNTADLGILIAQFNTAGPLADLNCDGTVNTADLGLLIGQFGSVGCQ